MDGCHDHLKPYLQMLEKLRAETFQAETNSRLMNHPYVIAAQSGQLTLAQRRAFCLEQLAIQQSDERSFLELSDIKKKSPWPDLFKFLYDGEVYVAKLLLKYAASLGLEMKGADNNPKDIIALNGYKLTARAQAYPSFWARLALNKDYGAGAAACAVNFPAWGGMCKLVLEALESNEVYGYSKMEPASSKEALAFIEFFATPIENLDLMAATVMERVQVKYDNLVDAVRLLQEYEILFWDAIYDAK